MALGASELPHETGALDADQAAERLIAKHRAGLMPEPRSEDDLLAERDPDAALELEDEADDADLRAEDSTDETDEDSDELVDTSDPVVKFDDGTELALSEVKRGYLRQQDYTRKTQETAELRKGLETQRAQWSEERRSVAERLTPLIQAAEAAINNPQVMAELNELRTTDPGAYAVRVMEQQSRIQNLQRLAMEQQQLREQAQREEYEQFQRERAEMATATRAKLIETIPAFKKDFDAEYQKLGAYVLEQGVPAEHWDNEVSHPVILMAWKARQYDLATRKTPATNDRLRKAPQPMRPGSAKPPGHAQQRALAEATERAASGSIEDAIALRRLKERLRR